MNVKLHIPAASQLSEYVTNIWEASGARQVSETIIPKGVIEIIFNLADPMKGSLPDGSMVQTPLCFIQGMKTQSMDVAHPGKMHLFGIVLQPGMVQGLLGILPSEFKNAFVDLTLIKPHFKILWHRLQEATSFADRVKVIEASFPVLSDSVCLRTQKFCSLFAADDISSFQSLDSLSQQVYYSTRHLNRKAQAIFGVSAEELISFKKFLYAVKLLHTTNNSLKAIAYDSHFYDQAHFCRVFKSYAGNTARQYRMQKSMVPFHLFSQEQ